MTHWLMKKRRYIIGTLFGFVFIFTLFNSAPSWILNTVVEKYSASRLKFYDTQGTFWNGSGLLVANGTKHATSAPILLLNWSIKLGFSKFIDINFNIGSKHVAEFYINKTGANLDNLDLSISLTQVEKLFDIIKDLSVSGNINISTKHIQVGKKATGNLMVKIDNISSGLSRANPLGSYVVVLTTDNGNIQVSSAADSILNLDGTGSTDSLILEGRIRDDRREDMMQFITLMGIPKPNGAYQLKIF